VHAAEVVVHEVQAHRVHQTLKTTPAVAAGIERHPWSLTQLVELLD